MHLGFSWLLLPTLTWLLFLSALFLLLRLTSCCFSSSTTSSHIHSHKDSKALLAIQPAQHHCWQDKKKHYYLINLLKTNKKVPPLSKHFINSGGTTDNKNTFKKRQHCPLCTGSSKNLLLEQNKKK